LNLIICNQNCLSRRNTAIYGLKGSSVKNGLCSQCYEEKEQNKQLLHTLTVVSIHKTGSSTSSEADDAEKHPASTTDS
jgi:hypothetical protein